MSILFIADVHLCTKKPDVTTNFLHFLHNKARHADALYILGDLFETWIGDDYLNYMHVKIAKELKKLKKNSIPCYFIHGNRDFLIGQHYANLCGITLLREPYIIEILGYRIIISHGDHFCINDKNYQIFKKITHKFWLKQLFLTLPISMRIYITNIIRNESLKNNKKQTKKNIKINMQKIFNLLIKHQATTLIHGHIHEAAIHTLINTSGTFNHITLGDWYKYGSIIELNKFGLSLIKFN